MALRRPHVTRGVEPFQVTFLIAGTFAPDRRAVSGLITSASGSQPSEGPGRQRGDVTAWMASAARTGVPLAKLHSPRLG
jgi:hypothetical protein